MLFSLSFYIRWPYKQIILTIGLVGLTASINRAQEPIEDKVMCVECVCIHRDSCVPVFLIVEETQIQGNDSEIAGIGGQIRLIITLEGNAIVLGKRQLLQKP